MTDRQKEFIRINHYLMTLTEMADELKATREEVQYFCKVEGIVPVKQGDRVIEFIKDNPTMTKKELAAHFGCTEQNIQFFLKKASATVPKEIKSPKEPLIELDFTEDQKQWIKDNYFDDQPKRKRFKEAYTQSHSPFGFADKLRGIDIKND